MLSIDVTHPDAEKFIDAKLEQGKVTGANISVKARDSFMEAVKENKEFIQHFPIDKETDLDNESIEYDELTAEQKNNIISRWYDSILQKLQPDEREVIQNSDILDWFQKNVERFDNIRILKTKIENAIFEKLADVFVIHPVS